MKKTPEERQKERMEDRQEERPNHKLKERPEDRQKDIMKEKPEERLKERMKERSTERLKEMCIASCRIYSSPCYEVNLFVMPSSTKSNCIPARHTINSRLECTY